MLKPYDLLVGVLNEIEKGLKDEINEVILADKFSLSSVHLRRLFKFAFQQPIGTYIRSRKLTASIEDLLYTNHHVIDIALDYGLGYEQSYIRTFKREFGITPGELRKSGEIVKITPPFHLFDSNRLADGLLFGPDIVMVPQFHAIGKKYKQSFRDALALDPLLAKRFFYEERTNIPGIINPDVHINLNFEAGMDADYYYYLPAAQVKTLDTIPEGYDGFTFPSSLCANFRFIGPSAVELNMAVADGMFTAIDNFMDDERQQYFLERKRINFEKILSSSNDGFFDHWEWFAPVIEKAKINASKKPDGIVETYQQEIPALRFIGKKHSVPCSEPINDSLFDRIVGDMDNWRLNYTFDAIEKQIDKDANTIYEGGNAYVSLMRKNDETFEYWLGMFMPAGTNVPEGYESMDFPPSTLAVYRVYGKRNAIIRYDVECRKSLAIETNRTPWFFQRFNWQKFFEEDKYGKRILEYGYFDTTFKT